MDYMQYQPIFDLIARGVFAMGAIMAACVLVPALMRLWRL